MRCLYCRKRLPLLRKLANGEFCCDAHRLLYLAEQEKLALACLVEAQQRFTQEALSTVRNSAAASPASRPSNVEEAAPIAAFVRVGPFKAVAAKSSRARHVQPLRWSHHAYLPREGRAPVPAAWILQGPALLAGVSASPASEACADLSLAPSTLSPLVASAPSPRRTAVLSMGAATGCLHVAGPVAPAECAVPARMPLHFAPGLAIPRRRSTRVLDGGLVFDIPQALARIESSEAIAGMSRFVLHAANSAAPVFGRLSARRPAATITTPKSRLCSHSRAGGARIASCNRLSALPLSGLDSAPRRLKAQAGNAISRRLAPVAGILAPSLEPALTPAGLAGKAIPQAVEGRPARREMECLPYAAAVAAAHPASGPLTFYGMLSDCVGPLPLGLAPAAAGEAPGVKLAASPVPAPDPSIRLSTGPVTLLGGRPAGRGRLLHLFSGFSNRDCSITLKGEAGSKWPTGAVQLPRGSCGVGTPEELGGMDSSVFPSGAEAPLWQRLARRVPARAAWAVMGILLTIGLLRHSTNSRPAPSFWKAQFSSVKQSISERAGMDVYEDFRSGLSLWQGKEGWSKSWSYDRTGFIHTGDLALFSPGVRLSDCRFEFLGGIDKKALSWVFRFKDFENYYAAKIVIVRAGRVPSASLVHYAVIEGKESARKEIPLPFPVQADTLYQVKMEIRGSDFTATVQDKLVDTWSDERLKRGGFGFFNSKGEQSLLRWVSVSHQYDALGRLCAFLAPYSLQTSKGESSQ